MFCFEGKEGLFWFLLATKIYFWFSEALAGDAIDQVIQHKMFSASTVRYDCLRDKTASLEMSGVEN